MTTIKKASQAGARRVTATLDSIATLFQTHAASLGIPTRVAMDFATRCDLLSDSIDRRKQAGYFNPAQIGVEQGGPLQFDPNNPFMAGEFTAEEKRALSEKQMAGQIAANAAKGVADPKLASALRKAAFNAALTALRTAKKSEEEDTSEGDEAPEGEEADEKVEKTARARHQAKKGEVPEALKDHQFKKDDDKGDEDEKADKKSGKKATDEGEEAEDEGEKADEEAKKTAKLFGLFS